jgi:hypothetical protein
VAHRRRSRPRRTVVSPIRAAGNAADQHGGGPAWRSRRAGPRRSGRRPPRCGSPPISTVGAPGGRTVPPRAHRTVTIGTCACHRRGRLAGSLRSRLPEHVAQEHGTLARVVYAWCVSPESKPMTDSPAYFKVLSDMSVTCTWLPRVAHRAYKHCPDHSRTVSSAPSGRPPAPVDAHDHRSHVNDGTDATDADLPDPPCQPPCASKSSEVPPGHLEHGMVRSLRIRIVEPRVPSGFGPMTVLARRRSRPRCTSLGRRLKLVDLVRQP